MKILNPRLFTLGFLIGGILGGFLFFNQCAFAAEPTYPSSAQGYVNDYANNIDPSDKAAITRLLQELEQKTTAEVAVVTVLMTQPETIENYAVKLFKKWGIGQKGKDNGVLFLVAAKDHRVRIETGYGLEGALPDVICTKIINNLVVPAFKSGEYSKGITAGAQAIVGLVAKEYNVQISGQEKQNFDSPQSDSNGGQLGLLFTLFILFLIFGRIYPFMYRRGGGYWYSGGGYSGGGFSGGSGGGFGGGSGGFGGGSSGGGGASGRW